MSYSRTTSGPSSGAAASSDMDVYIKLTSGRVLPLRVTTSTTVASICSQLGGHESVPSARVSLKYQGKVLNKSKTVGEYGVCKETVLRVEILATRTLNIFVKTEEKRSIPLTVENITTVAELKRLIHVQESIEPHRQTLKLAGRELSSGPTSLEECGVDDESVLALAVSSAAATSSATLPSKTKEELNDDEKQDVLASFAASFGSDQVVDVVFSFDTTGSMYSCLAQVRQQVGETVKRLLQDIPNIQIGIIAHGDYCDQDSSYVLKQIDLTSKTEEIVKFVKDVPSTGGGDCPECYEWVLVKAQKLSWRENSAKALVVIGDALPHEASYTDQNVSWREELAKLTDMGVKVYGVQALSQSESVPFYKELARFSGGKYLRFANFKLITDMFLAVCYGASCPQQLQAYQLEVETEGRMTEELGKVFEELHKDTEEAADTKTKADDSAAAVASGDTKGTLSLDADYSSPNAVHRAWWSRSDDHTATSKYVYNAKRDHFSQKSRAVPSSTSSSSSSSAPAPRTRTSTMPAAAPGNKASSRWSLRRRRSSSSSSRVSAPAKRAPCRDVAPCRDEYHVGVLGASGVGKTSLILQYTGRRFPEEPVTTATDKYEKLTTHAGRAALVEIVDSGSTDASVDACIRHCECFLVVYSPSDTASVARARALRQRVRDIHAGANVPVVLATNKTDLPAKQHQVTKAERLALAAELDCLAAEVSAKDVGKTDAMFAMALQSAAAARLGMGPTSSGRTAGPSSPAKGPARRPSFSQRLRRLVR